ncbi:helix-turn-helix domain-containing protein [Actinomadura rupiterrae]|uniref:helix-turn-helix domain-containing protein n=1 Tax=Actinomadura rupiterrae TaxID=559627 RepID=UPI0020A4D33F|nr:helix-turn-helix transcriptional regulator [Actinomadura rupiterrae]MCP2336030.1 transcriptional regulator with XRE-family HTH domain [Actinomadura rupiterrae]
MYDWAAYDLLQFRTVRGASTREVAEIIGKHRSLISKIEAGESKLQLEDAKKIDKSWQTGGHFTRIINLARSRHKSEWGAERDASEFSAIHIRVWSLGWVPVLAQTEDYARAALTEAGRQDVEDAVRARMKRQETLKREAPPLIWALIDQDALEHQVGDRDVHAAQLAHLIELASSPTWVIRTVPRTAGGHVGRDGSIELYTVGSEVIPYTETVGPGRLITDPSETSQYEVWFRRIGDVAESKQATLRRLRETVEEF